MSIQPNPAEQKVLNAIPPGAPAKAAPNRRLRIIGALFALAALGGAGRMWWYSHYFVETDNAYVAGHVHPVSARIAGVVSRVLVEDNQLVRAGDPIAELDPFDQHVRAEQIQAQLDIVEQQLLQADAQLAQSQAQAAAAAAQVRQSEALLLRARQDAERYSQLYSGQMKAVSKAELDGAIAGRAGATAELAARREGALAAKAQGAQSAAAREVLKAQARVLRVQLKDAQQQLAYNRILAPVAGRLGRRSVEVGQRVQPGQQLAAIVQEQVWVTANFKETQLAELRPGLSVAVRVDALPGQLLKGKLDSFAPASGAQFALLPADNATGNFTKIVQRVPVKIVLDADQLKALGGRVVPGMSVLAEVELDRQARP